MLHPRSSRLLLADINGREARVALAEPGRPVLDVLQTPCDSQVALIELLQNVAARLDGPLDGVAIAAPGPVLDGVLQLTHADIRLDAQVLAERLGVHRLHLVNNFTARALAVPLLEPAALEAIGQGVAHRDAPAIAVGPSETGVGMSILYPDGFVGWTAAAAEGGHVDLAAGSDRESAVIAFLRARHGHVSAEHVLSGHGVLEVARAVSALEGSPDRSFSADSLRQAADSGDSAARETFALASGWLGAFCGNLVLTTGARSGAYVISATVLAWGHHLDRALVRERFEAKGRMAGYMRDVPLYLVNADNSGLLGLTTLFN